MKNKARFKQSVYAVHVIDDDINYIYIGSGYLGDRKSGNPSKLSRGVHDNKILQAAYNRVGECVVEILEENIDIADEARELENTYVAYFKKLDNVIVCNRYPAVVSKDYERKLDYEKALEVKKLLAEGKKNKEIAQIYDVNPSLISKIKTGRLWSHVEIINDEEGEAV